MSEQIINFDTAHDYKFKKRRVSNNVKCNFKKHFENLNVSFVYILDGYTGRLVVVGRKN